MGDLESREPSSEGGLFTFGHAERTLFICGSERWLAAALVRRVQAAVHFFDPN